MKKKAIALTYEDQMHAPTVVAKGNDVIAEKIIEQALLHDVPIREDKTLVALLDAVEVSEQIPSELYGLVAELFAFLYKLDHAEKPKK
ncbi:EscU/YscU/HrcU family type III secretion system export apparatus switch protein [Exiguobacterium flavidum]|uniref:EscU/YscU/HrcU family type III secretion system export apparatus switch protein n=1 Tax=Exiguobacterium flavidum TaxID=2184695 RepID=UPI000DF75BB5|nr:EscU/YscU/HrcU family type III secretion system export apparatus switch protein [Exiguobacterium flavidum]